MSDTRARPRPSPYGALLIMESRYGPCFIFQSESSGPAKLSWTVKGQPDSRVAVVTAVAQTQAVLGVSLAVASANVLTLADVDGGDPLSAFQELRSRTDMLQLQIHKAHIDVVGIQEPTGKQTCS